ncbi:hypothetical protein ACS7SF_02790 [Ralstonia sp. 25C]|uniref:hypothetical protein n=1 Tax=Ralstonia sp. 25C TaxID=3447363 RepID=UPI003F74CE05
MVDMVLEARKWPDADIIAEIVTNAAAEEDNPSALAKSRGEQLRDFFIQLGIKPEHVFVSSSQILDKPFPFDRHTGRGGYLQLAVSLSPWCHHGCQHLCDDPRVTPTTRVIK